MAYTVRNDSKETYLFNISHNDNVAEVFILVPGAYVVSDKIAESFFISDDMEKQRLIRDIFNASGEGRLSVKDGNGDDVSYSDYKTANA